MQQGLLFQPGCFKIIAQRRIERFEDRGNC
jgi:hypothetical protein